MRSPMTYESPKKFGKGLASLSQVIGSHRHQGGLHPWTPSQGETAKGFRVTARTGATHGGAHKPLKG